MKSNSICRINNKGTGLIKLDNNRIIYNIKN